MYNESIFIKDEFLSDGNNFFMIDHLCCFKLFDIENTVQDEKVSTQLES